VIRALARAVFESDPIELHPLMVALATRELSTGEMREAALQIGHVVDHFPRLLAAMLANLPDWRLRMPLADNLFEEHGRSNPALVHAETYRRFLSGLGVLPEALAAHRPSVPVLAYNRAVLDLCLHHAPAEGLGALAVIEEIVARVSPIVSRSVRRSGVTNATGHFSDHEVLDLTHANEIYALAEQLVAEAGGRELAERGLRLGWYYHRRLYTDVLALIRGAHA
jgi:pyrroloquinoline-quinone synthase